MTNLFTSRFIYILLIICTTSILSIGQSDVEEEDEYTYYEVQHNKNIISGGFDYLIPQGDFGNKIGKNSLGGAFSYFRQINYSRFFLGVNITSRRFFNYEILNYEPDVTQSTTVSQFTASLVGRVYPELYISVIEFFFEGGAGVNSM